MYCESYTLTKYYMDKKEEKYILTVLLLTSFFVEYVLFEKSLEDKSEIEKEKKDIELLVIYLIAIELFMVNSKLSIDFDRALTIETIMFILAVITGDKY